MEFIASLWLPIVLSAVAVFIASFVAWMLMPHHKGDWKGFPDEPALAEAIRRYVREPELRHRHAQSARQRAQEFTLAKQIDRFERLYLGMIEPDS